MRLLIAVLGVNFEVLERLLGAGRVRLEKHSIHLSVDDRKAVDRQYRLFRAIVILEACLRHRSRGPLDGVFWRSWSGQSDVVWIFRLETFQCRCGARWALNGWMYVGGGSRQQWSGADRQKGYARKTALRRHSCLPEGARRS